MKKSIEYLAQFIAIAYTLYAVYAISYGFIHNGGLITAVCVAAVDLFFIVYASYMWYVTSISGNF